MQSNTLIARSMELAQSHTGFFVGGITMGEECARDILDQRDEMKSSEIIGSVNFAVKAREDRIQAIPRRLDDLDASMAVRAGMWAGADELIRREVKLVA